MNCVPPLLSLHPQVILEKGGLLCFRNAPSYCEFPIVIPQACSLTIETLYNDPTSVAVSWMLDPPLISTSPHLEVLAYRLSSTSPSSLTISLLTQLSFPTLLKSYLPYLLLLLPSLLSLFLSPSLPSPRLLLSLLPLLLLLHSLQNTNHPPLLYSLGCVAISLLLLIYSVVIILLHEGEGNQRNGQLSLHISNQTEIN